MPKIKRPALRYYGGKWKLAEWIIQYFPSHKSYVEPCGGAASVLIHKNRSELETYNDADGNVVNFFRVLRDNPDELIRKIQLTPWSREEFEQSLVLSGDEVEMARKFFVKMWMGINAGTSYHEASNGWRCSNGEDTRDWVLYHDELHNLADRFIGVQIEKDDARNIIKRFNTPDTLVYFDPPYVLTTRGRKSKDRYEMDITDDFHRECGELLVNHSGFVVVSGYPSDLYSEIFEDKGFSRIDGDSTTNNGGKRVESLWLSPRTSDALNQNEFSFFGTLIP